MSDDYALDETEQDAAAEIADAPDDYLAAGEVTVRYTYLAIERELKALREEKERIQDRINELVEAEQLWRPLVHRLENGIPRRGSSA